MNFQVIPHRTSLMTRGERELIHPLETETESFQIKVDATIGEALLINSMAQHPYAILDNSQKLLSRVGVGVNEKPARFGKEYEFTLDGQPIGLEVQWSWNYQGMCILATGIINHTLPLEEDRPYEVEIVDSTGMFTYATPGYETYGYRDLHVPPVFMIKNKDGFTIRRNLESAEGTGKVKVIFGHERFLKDEVVLPDRLNIDELKVRAEELGIMVTGSPYWRYRIGNKELMVISYDAIPLVAFAQFVRTQGALPQKNIFLLVGVKRETKSGLTQKSYFETYCVYYRTDNHSFEASSYQIDSLYRKALEIGNLEEAVIQYGPGVHHMSFHHQQTLNDFLAARIV